MISVADRPAWAIGTLVLIALMGGCVKAQGPPPAPQSPTTDTAPSAPSNPARSPSAGVGRQMNLTDCSGSLAVIIVPRAWLADDLPAGYEVREDSPAGEGKLVLAVGSCGKLSVNGVDAGPTTFAFTSVGIKRPEDAPEGVRAWYTVEAFFDHDAAVAWLSNDVFHGNNGTSNHSYEPIATSQGYAQTSGEVATSNGTLYAYDGVTSQGDTAEERTLRYYYGPNPDTDYWDALVEQRATGEWAGTMDIAEGSVIAKIIARSGAFPVSIGAVHSQGWQLTPPE